jgi:hypothetical protein
VKDGGNSKSSMIYPIPDFYYRSMIMILKGLIVLVNEPLAK